ncbi:MAG: hypothetical protein E6J43_08730 [Chloroflexi bacterium]|nr:MAG: hypothetical protein E6J43_08730 [Chloroflexota bacterium]
MFDRETAFLESGFTCLPDWISSAFQGSAVERYLKIADVFPLAETCFLFTLPAGPGVAGGAYTGCSRPETVIGLVAFSWSEISVALDCGLFSTELLRNTVLGLGNVTIDFLNLDAPIFGEAIEVGLYATAAETTKCKE